MSKQHIKVNGGVVAAGSTYTANAGAEMLRQGGNAVDAAVAANLAAFCAEPVLTSPFGGGLGMVAGPNTPPTSLNFFARVPGLQSQYDKSNIDFRKIDVQFGPAVQSFHVGKGSSAVPLLLPGLLDLQQRFGSLPLQAIVEPALDFARNGIQISDELSGIFQILEPILTLTEASKQQFAPKGQLLQAGETFKAPGLANVFEQFAKNDVRPIMELFQKEFSGPNGLITAEDLVDLSPEEKNPVHVQAGPFDIYLSPPPASGGLLVGFGLKLLEQVPSSIWQDSTQKALAMVAAMATTQLVRTSTLDPLLHARRHESQTELENFLSETEMKKWHGVFHEALESNDPLVLPPENQLGSTTHISTIDAQGLGCSITSSNGEGCGYLVPETSAMANNFMGEEDLHPNGFHKMPAGSKLTSMMCPTAVKDADGLKLMLGTGGSNRIRTALLQVLGNHLFGDQPLQEAVMAPRTHYEGGVLYVESTGPQKRAMNPETLERLSALPVEHLIFEEPNMFFGGVNAAARNYEGAGDQRRGGNIAVVKPESST